MLGEKNPFLFQSNTFHKVGQIFTVFLADSAPNLLQVLTEERIGIEGLDVLLQFCSQSLVVKLLIACDFAVDRKYLLDAFKAVLSEDEVRHAIQDIDLSKK